MKFYACVSKRDGQPGWVSTTIDAAIIRADPNETVAQVVVLSRSDWDKLTELLKQHIPAGYDGMMLVDDMTCDEIQAIVKKVSTHNE